MRKGIVSRVLEEASYILNNDKTIREAATYFCVSKSTIHNDMKNKLYFIDDKMYNKVSSVLKYHTNIKHIRGGEATKRKFLAKKCNYNYKNY